MSTAPPRPWTGLALAASGWVALAATQLPAANPLRVAVVTAFLLIGPGTAAVRLAAPKLDRRDRKAARLECVVLTLAVSLAIGTLVAEVFYLTRSLSTVRAVSALAALTTVLALAPYAGPGRRARRGAPDAPGAPRPPEHLPGTSGRAGRTARTGRAALAGCLLVSAAACGGQSASAPAGVDPAATEPAAAGPWHLVFQDGFQGSTLDSSRWTTCYDWNDAGCTNAGNHELEWYLPSQVTVGGGMLSLNALRSATTGSDGKTYPWTSGMVSTGRDSWYATPRHTFAHGYFAAAIRIPAADGMFPAFWLMPDTRSTPPELDVAEFAGTTQHVQMTVHWAGPGGKDQHLAGSYGPADFPSGFHVFALDWESDSLTWYIDGVSRFRTTGHVPDVPMELLLDLAVGYPVAPPDTVSSAAMKVDWVRVWQH
ncbi:family 16 glycosylhydrolase [Streptacidiphilus sp. 4-A2]|nr:family 16 glycosylhydrolase [Streptacidiphilus sp. 4-A2]